MTDKDRQRLILILTEEKMKYTISDVINAGINVIENEIMLIKNYERKKANEVTRSN